MCDKAELRVQQRSPVKAGKEGTCHSSGAQRTRTEQAAGPHTLTVADIQAGFGPAQIY